MTCALLYALSSHFCLSVLSLLKMHVKSVMSLQGRGISLREPKTPVKGCWDMLWRQSQRNPSFCRGQFQICLCVILQSPPKMLKII